MTLPPPIGLNLLDGTRVLDVSDGIAGPYTTKLLADAGADVVKVEPRDGDSLRRWTSSAVLPAGATGALFQYLNAGKRSIVADLDSDEFERLVLGADLLVDSGRLSLTQLEALRATAPSLVVVSVTPFGRRGPWAGRPSTEFTLQAMCASMGGRGTADREPLQAGGRLGEWIGGVYAGVAALAGLRSAATTGGGDVVDVSMFECMSITMGGYGSLNASLGGAKAPGPARMVELPSIEPTADGYVGFCTITGQQFQDFLVLIDHPELAADADLASFVGRQRRKDEFLSLVWEWTAKRSTEEIIEAASAMRIPVSPIATPDTVTKLDQFVERGVFQSPPGAIHVQPRPPYRVDGQPHGPVGCAPALGAHTGAVSWPARPPRPPVPARGRPLTGVRVVDLTAFWAGPAATQVLALLGADVIKVESVQRPDGMRFTSARPPGSPGWWEWSSIYQAVNVNKRGVTLDLSRPAGRELLLRLVGQSDVLIENFSPRVLDNFGITWEAVQAANPRASMIRMPAFGLDGPWRDRTGFAQTMEQATGMAWMTGFADGPAVIPRGPCDPIAGMHAVVALLAVLHERERSGRGHLVESTMVEAALNVAAEIVLECSAYGVTLSRNGNRGPVAAPQGVYACRGEERWLALAISTDDEWRSLCAVLGSPEWSSSPRLAHASGRRAAHDEIDEHLRRWARAQELDDVCDRLVAAGVPAGPVVEPADVIANPQHRARGFVERFDHPLLGSHEVVGAPFRFDSIREGWIRAPAPMLGQHNDEVFRGVLGLGDDELGQLRDQAVIGERPVSR